MTRVGLTGGYATGKSFVASELAKLGCYVIRADELGHAVLRPDGAAYAPTLQLFGSKILTAEGIIDRKKLAEIVFSSPDLLAQLNAIVHPAVFQKEQELTTAFFEREPDGILVYEAAILIETGRWKQYDWLILTTASEDVQIARAMHRDGATREEALARIGRQLSFQEKREYADFVIDTSGTKEETIRQVQQVYPALRKESDK